MVPPDVFGVCAVKVFVLVFGFGVYYEFRHRFGGETLLNMAFAEVSYRRNV